MSEVVCSKCGASRPPELAATTKRPPCAQCGGTALTFKESVKESTSAAMHCAAELVPGDQTRDWRRRWRLIQEELQLISLPHSEVMSSDAIHASFQRLCSFYILAYHLKDSLREAAPVLGLAVSVIEAEITGDSRLALLADLANLDKHGNLTKPPRSGSAPAFRNLSGIDSKAGSGWHLSVKIAHRTAILDGMTVAQDAVIAWREKLLAWGVI